MADKIRFRMVVKDGPREIATIEGRATDTDMRTLHEVDTVLQLEKDLERLFGHRFHINLEEA